MTEAESPSPSYATDLETLATQVRVETYRARGPGGQRKNKVETAVRLTHLPTGITVVASERRSQAQNKALAYLRLQRRLLKLAQRRKRRVPTQPTAGSEERRKVAKQRRATRKSARRPPEAESDPPGYS